MTSDLQQLSFEQRNVLARIYDESPTRGIRESVMSSSSVTGSISWTGRQDDHSVSAHELEVTSEESLRPWQRAPRRSRGNVARERAC